MHHFLHPVSARQGGEWGAHLELLVGVTNEKGQTHLFVYDAAGRVTSQTDYYGHSHGF
jgi:YD repeat-containing protein